MKYFILLFTLFCALDVRAQGASSSAVSSRRQWEQVNYFYEKWLSSVESDASALFYVFPVYVQDAALKNARGEAAREAEEKIAAQKIQERQRQLEDAVLRVPLELEGKRVYENLPLLLEGKPWDVFWWNREREQLDGFLPSLPPPRFENTAQRYDWYLRLAERSRESGDFDFYAALRVVQWKLDGVGTERNLAQAWQLLQPVLARFWSVADTEWGMRNLSLLRTLRGELLLSGQGAPADTPQDVEWLRVDLLMKSLVTWNEGGERARRVARADFALHGVPHGEKNGAEKGKTPWRETMWLTAISQDALDGDAEARRELVVFWNRYRDEVDTILRRDDFTLRSNKIQVLAVRAAARACVFLPTGFAEVQMAAAQFLQQNDLLTAVELFRRAAAQGHNGAALQLSLVLAHTEKDTVEAVFSAAEVRAFKLQAGRFIAFLEGDVENSRTRNAILALWFMGQANTSVDESAAVLWVNRLMDSNDFVFAFWLGHAYLNGAKGWSRDVEKAQHWFKQYRYRLLQLPKEKIEEKAKGLSAVASVLLEKDAVGSRAVRVALAVQYLRESLKIRPSYIQFETLGNLLYHEPNVRDLPAALQAMKSAAMGYASVMAQLAADGSAMSGWFQDDYERVSKIQDDIKAEIARTVPNKRSNK